MLMKFHNAGSEPDSPRIIAAYPDRLFGLVDTSMVHLQCWVQQGVQDTAAGIVMQVSCKAMTLRGMTLSKGCLSAEKTCRENMNLFHVIAHATFPSLFSFTALPMAQISHAQRSRLDICSLQSCLVYLMSSIARA